MLHKTFLGVILLLLSNNLFADEPFTGKVVAVIDGDNIGVMQDGEELRIRLYGSDCPEKGAPFFRQAKEQASSLVFGKEVKVTALKKEKYGRLIAKITLPDRLDLSEALVAQGMCFWCRQYAPNDFRLMNLEVEARKAGKGVWSEPNPKPPWEVRKERRAR